MSLIAAAVAFFIEGVIAGVIAFFSMCLLIYLFIYFRKILIISARVKKVEAIFPDFLQLMASNLRAGMTIDRAILTSSRPEFAPLDEEIVTTGFYDDTIYNGMLIVWTIM